MLEAIELRTSRRGVPQDAQGLHMCTSQGHSKTGAEPREMALCAGTREIRVQAAWSEDIWPFGRRNGWHGGNAGGVLKGRSNEMS